MDFNIGRQLPFAVYDGLLPRMSDARHQITTRPQSPGARIQGEYHRVALHARVPGRARELAKDAFEDLVSPSTMPCEARSNQMGR